MRIGFVGLGVMGAPMAQNLLGSGYALTVYNRTAARAAPLGARGAARAATLADVAVASDVVALMVTDAEAVHAVVDGADGLLAHMAAGTVIVDFSTIGPRATVELAQSASARGVVWMDAPVTGGDAGAKAGTLTIMVGGDEETFRAIRPLLQVVGERIVHVGPSGAGQSMKLVANLVSGLNLLAAAEGLRLAEAAGIPLQVLTEVLPASSARSFEVDKLLQRWPTRATAPGFSLANRTKDLGLALDMADALGFSTVLARAAYPAFQRAAAAGGQDDETGVARHWDSTPRSEEPSGQERG